MEGDGKGGSLLSEHMQYMCVCVYEKGQPPCLEINRNAFDIKHTVHLLDGFYCF